MSRPKPRVLLSYTDPKTYQSEQVITIQAFYVVFYEGKPINLKNVNNLVKSQTVSLQYLRKLQSILYFTEKK